MILLADDFESEINLLKGLLLSLGILESDIIIAYDGQQAIDLIRNHEFSYLITDFNMPYFTGADVIKEAKNKGVKNILLRSSHSNNTLQSKLSEANIDLNSVSVVCKRDYDSTELKAYLKEFLT